MMEKKNKIKTRAKYKKKLFKKINVRIGKISKEMKIKKNSEAMLFSFISVCLNVESQETI